MKADKQLTAAAGFKDAKSYIAPNGREVLYGKDWKARKQELWKRADGRCEFVYRTSLGWEITRCFQEGQIPAHIEPRYPKRDDRLSNMKLYCFEHDRLMEKQAWRRTRFGERAAGQGQS